jgi:hypothetical protein
LTSAGVLDLDPECCYATALRFDFVTAGERCDVSVVFNASGGVTVTTSTGNCKSPGHGPRCTVKEIWARVHDQLGELPSGVQGSVTWNTLGDGAWSVQAHNNHGALAVDDKCP